MVGLPYPNLKSPELKEKMDYLNANMVSGMAVSLWHAHLGIGTIIGNS